MSIRVGIVSTAHVHAPSFVSCAEHSPLAEVVGVWDDDATRGAAFCQERRLPFVPRLDDLLEKSDAVVICSENMKHRDQIVAAAKAGKSILCEKPVSPVREHGKVVEEAVQAAGVIFMTAFPCPFSPAFQSAAAKVKAGDIGRVLAVNTTNQGSCPFGWFIEKDLSGGGAMVDHVVHVTDLLRRLLGENPSCVQAQTGHNMYGKEWDDTAMVTLGFPSGVFATIDSSWSKASGYKTWGNVKLTIIGEKGVIEADLFGPGPDVYTSKHWHCGLGANLDGLMVQEFFQAVSEKRAPSVTLEDGLRASQVTWGAYESAARSGACISLN